MTVGAHRKVVTVLFCDVVGSTALGESVDPEALQGLLARYFERMKEVVESHGGSVEKFIGDAVMAVFGVPMAHEDDALRACRAAVEMRDALPGLGVEGRIGVNSGEVLAGTEERLATGDVVNVAARLEQAAQPGEVLIGRETLGLVRTAAEVGDERLLELKGKAAPVSAYPLVNVHEAEERSHAYRFVGRERELRQLADAWSRTLAGPSCELVTIVGDPGVGKSRLVSEALARTDARVVRGRCLSYGDGITYWPVVEVVKQLDALPNDESAARAIRSLLGKTDAVSGTDEIAWAFRKLLEEQAPLVVCFDDIQWAEETFLELVESTPLLSTGAPILVLCMTRPELIDRRPGWPGTLRLDPLAEEEAAAVIGDAIAGEVRQRIVRASAGNPLFLTEMAALSGADGEVEVPPTLRALLAARLDQLNESERMVLERGAVEGELFHRGTIQALAPDETELTPRLAALVRRDLVRPDRPVLPREDAYRFRHLLIRDAAYDALPKSTRADLHRRFAEWLQSHGGELVELDEIVGYHLEQAYSFRRQLGLIDETDPPLGERAAAYLETSGQRAAVRGDAPAAARFFERAAALLPTEHPQRLKLLTSLGAALTEAGAWDRVRDVLAEAEATAEQVGDAGFAAHARVRLANFDLHTDVGASHAKVRSELDQAIGVFEALGDKAGLAHALDFGAKLRMWGGENAHAQEEMELAAQYAREAGDRAQEIEALSGIVITLAYGPQPITSALKRIEEIEQQTEGARRLEAAALRSRALLEAMAGNIERARELVATAETIAAELGLETLRTAGILPTAGQIELMAGDEPAAERFLREAYTSLYRSKSWAHLASVAPLLAEALLAQGEADEAETLLELTTGWIIDDDREGQVLLASARSKLAALRGDATGAETFARAAVERCANSDGLAMRTSALVRLAEALELGNRGDDASAALREALLLCERKGNVVGAEDVRRRLGRLDPTPRRD